MINRTKLAPYVMPIVYFFMGVILVIGLTLIAIRAAFYEFVEWIKNK